MVHIKDDRYEIDGYFYVQKIKFSISLGGVVRYTLVLRSIFTLALGLSLVSCVFSGSPSQDAICYGNVESLIDLPDMSISAEVYSTNVTVSNDIVSGWVNEQGGFELQTSETYDGRIVFLQLYFNGGVSSGVWRTSDSVLIPNTWTTVTVTRKTGSTTTPKIYINGTEVSLDTVSPPIGTMGSVNGMDFCIGNVHGQDASTQFSKPFYGKIKRVDIHNKILTPSEVAIWAGGQTVTDGLVFQGSCVRTKDLNIYNGTTLTSETKFLDNIFGTVGTINGNPTCTYP